MGDVIATICARGGSRGVPGKNLRTLQGRPLIAWAIQCATASPDVSGIVVSTDDDAIAAAAEACGVRVPFRRPPELATDTAAKLPVIRHAVAWMEEQCGRRAEFVLDLDVTVPLRTPEDVQACVAALRQGQADAVITTYEAERNPYFNMVQLEGGWAQPVVRPPQKLVRRQDAPRVWSVTPAVFGFRRDFLDRGDYIYDGRVATVEIPRERAIDIDTELDFGLVEFILSRAAGATQ